MKILFDIDGVIADFTKAFSQQAVDLGFLKASISVHQQDKWDLSCGLGSELTEIQVSEVWRIIDTTKWWWTEKVPFILDPNASDCLSSVVEHPNIETYFITNRLGGNPNVQKQTHEWLLYNDIHLNAIITAKNKPVLAQAIGITHSIEDRVDNANLIAGKSYLIDRLYNRGGRLERLKIVTTVQQFLDEVLKHARV